MLAGLAGSRTPSVRKVGRAKVLLCYADGENCCGQCHRAGVRDSDRATHEINGFLRDDLRVQQQGPPLCLASFLQERAASVHAWAERSAMSRLEAGFTFANDHDGWLPVSEEAIQAGSSSGKAARPGCFSSSSPAS